MKSFEFKEIDAEGIETLEAIANADKFNEWMFETIRPYCKGKILEVGSGIGNISEFFINNKYDIVLSDVRDNYCDILSQKFNNSVVLLDLVDDDFDTRYKDILGTCDTVFALNVVEHIKDDGLAIRNCKKLLRTDGNLVILVPSYQLLYNRFDEELEHYRRYNRTGLNALITNSDLKLIHSQYFNFAGIFGWILSGSILKKKTIPAGQMRLYNYLVPIFKIVDKIMFNRMGLSVISVGKK